MSGERQVANDPGEHSAAAGAPGASGPSEVAYEGAATIGDEGAAAGAESFRDPNGTPRTSWMRPPKPSRSGCLETTADGPTGTPSAAPTKGKSRQ